MHGFLLAMSLVVLPLSENGQDGQPQPTLKDFAWLSGRWTATLPNGDQLEEVWTASAKDLMASFRWADKEGKAKFYELIVVTEEKGKLVLRLRHFNPDFTAWEEKTKPMVAEAVTATPDKVVFQVNGDAKVLLTYERTGPDAFTATLDRPNQPPMKLQFQRVKAGS